MNFVLKRQCEIVRECERAREIRFSEMYDYLYGLPQYQSTGFRSFRSIVLYSVSVLCVGVL